MHQYYDRGEFKKNKMFRIQFFQFDINFPCSCILQLCGWGHDVSDEVVQQPMAGDHLWYHQIISPPPPPPTVHVYHRHCFVLVLLHPGDL